mgnify:CR=1 FL=1
MASKSLSEISLDGLWKNNPALVQLLGLCPLLATSASVVNALGLGLATLAVLAGSNLAVSLIRNHVPDAVRLPAFVMIIASVVTVVELLMQAYTYELYEILGIFIPLIVTNCIILGRADAFACKNGILPSIVDGATMGFGFTCVLLVLGAMREILGQGVIFSDMQLLFGPMAADWKIVLFQDYPNFLFAILPPGGFMALGILIAVKNIIDERRKEAAKAKVITEEGSSGPKRVRVTGKIS